MKEITKSYIAGFFDGEGCVSKRWLAIVNTNKDILEKISTFLTEIGIENKIKSRKTIDVWHKPSYVLSICGRQNLIRFNEKIPLQEEKKEKIEKMLKNYKYTMITIQNKNAMHKLRKDGLSYKKIAKILKCSAGSVHNYCHKTIK